MRSSVKEESEQAKEAAAKKTRIEYWTKPKIRKLSMDATDAKLPATPEQTNPGGNGIRFKI